MDTKSEKILKTVDKNLAFVIKETHQFLKKINSLIQFKIICGLRTPQQQFELYKIKKSYKDGYKLKSKHQEGKAVDIMVIFNNKITWKIEYYYYIASIVEYIAFNHKINIKWGGWFKKKDGSRFIDGGHFEIID
ncbi:MAG: hypothetical protein BV456_01095 [Thermoplasmata archaeon M8B2D]|nr:MAG: hypothetical protein BV456_01095 [Thermoplasmata archaeon M8B2D]